MFYRATACNAMRGIAMRKLSVCQTRKLSDRQTDRKALAIPCVVLHAVAQ